MSSEDRDESDPLQSLIADILEAESRGESVDRKALIDSHPDHADSLREFFASHDQMKSAADVDPPTLPPRSSGPASEDPTIAPGATPLDDPTLPPTEPGGDDATLPPTEGTSQKGEPTVGDQVRYFGDYELLEEIARGGMGVVFKARQKNLNRVVAIKMILAGQFAGEEDVQRFYTEAEAAAQLDHPGIVPIFEIGEHAGQHYFSMGYIEGLSLAGRVADGPLPAKESADLVEKICAAMAYAHAGGVIHRDLKPANILIDSSGQPKVTDFGLAKNTEADSNLTGTGQVLGTPAYMPPEQASGNIDEVGPLADVYSLGAILYCLLTGRPPFQAASPMDTLLQVLEKEPALPRQLVPTLPRDLETICLKSLEKDPRRRYQSAADLGAELGRFLNGEPIEARPISSAQRAWKFCRRKPLVSSLSAAVALLLLGVAVAAPIVAWKQSSLRGIAETNEREARELAATEVRLRDEAVAARKEIEREKDRFAGLLYGTRISLAHREWLDSNSKRAQQLLHECPPERRDWEWHYLDGLMRADELSIFAHGIPASVHFFPDGKSIMTRGLQDGKIKLWDATTGLEKESHGVPQLRSSWPVDNEHTMVVAGNTVVYVGIDDGHLEPYGDFGVRSVAGLLFDNGKRIAAAFADGTITLYKRPSKEEIYRTPKRLKSQLPHVFAPDARLVAGSEGITAKLWDVQSGELRFEFQGHMKAVAAIAFSPDGSTLASVDLGGTLILTDVASGRRLHSIAAHSGGITSVAFSPDGNRVATGSIDRTCRIFDVATGSQVLTIRGHTQPIIGVNFDPSGNRLATASTDGTARIWNIRNRLAMAPEVAQQLKEDKVAHLGHIAGLESRILYGHLTPVYDVAISPDGKFATTSGFKIGNTQGKHYIKVWSLEDSSIHASFPVPGGYLHTLAYSADSKYLIVASGGAGDAVSQGSVAIWDLESKEKFRTLEGTACMFNRAVLNEQNDILAVAYGNLNNGKLRFYSVPACELLRDQEVIGERLSAIAFSESGNELLSTSVPGGNVKIWNARTGQQVGSFIAHGSGVFQIAVSADDKLATANIDGTIGVWDWKNKQQLGELRGHSTYAVDVAFNPDGTRLLSSSEDESVKVWDLNNFSELLTFRDHTGPVLGADWSADGRMIASTARDGALIIRQLEDSNDDVDSIDQWVTVFEDQFERDELGPDWGPTSPESGRIEDGKLVGTLQPVVLPGSSFSGAFLTLTSVDLPRTVEISADVTLRQSMLTQFVLRNTRTEQYIAPFISSATTPYGFIGSSVQVARGEGKETKILGGRSNVQMEVGTTYRMRVIRSTDQLKYFLDDKLVEHVRIPTMEADRLILSGCWSNLNDQIEFDNVSIRIPKQAVRQQEIRSQVGQWLTKMLIPDLVEEQIADHFSDQADRDLAISVLRGFSAGKDLKPEEILKAFDAVAMRSDATDEEYDIAMRQAEFYFQRNQDRWQTGRVGLALLRGGKVKEALEIFDRGIQENLAESGHAFGLLYAGRALALHELGRDDEAKVAHRNLLDSNLTNSVSNPLPGLSKDLQEKVPIDNDPIRESLIKMLISRDKAYWYGGDIEKSHHDTSNDFVAVQGRGPEPGKHDLLRDRSTNMKLEAIHSNSNPPARLQILWDQIQVDHGDDRATLRWVAISKIEGMIFRFGQRYEFELRDQNWKIVKQRTWQIDQRIGNQWQRRDDEHWSRLDNRIEEMKVPNDPATAQTLVDAQRYEEAFELASGIAEKQPDNAANLAILGQAAITLGKFQIGIDALEKARRADPGAKMPWFLTRVMRSFANHQPNPFGLDFHPTEEVMVSAHRDRALVAWNLKDRKILHTFVNAHGQLVGDVVFSQDGSKIISVGWDRVVNIFDAKTAQRIGQMSGHLGVIYRIERHPTKDVVVTAAGDGTAKIWDLTEKRELVTLSGHSTAVMGAAFSPDGINVATASRDGTIRIWDADSGRELAKIDAHEGGASRVDWTPDGTRLVSSGLDDLVCVWDADTHEQIAALKGHKADIDAVRVSTDGKLAASADSAGEIWVWDLDKLQSLGVLRDAGANYNLRFHDGSLYSTGADITQWDIDFTRSPLADALVRAAQAAAK